MYFLCAVFSLCRSYYFVFLELSICLEFIRVSFVIYVFISLLFIYVCISVVLYFLSYVCMSLFLYVVISCVFSSRR